MDYLDSFKIFDNYKEKYDPKKGDYVFFDPSEDYLRIRPEGRNFAKKTGWINEFYTKGSYQFELENPPQFGSKILNVYYQQDSPFVKMKEPWPTRKKEINLTQKNIGYSPKLGDRVVFRPQDGPMKKKYPYGVRGEITKVYPDLIVSWGYEFLPDGEKTPISINLGIFNKHSVAPFMKLSKKVTHENKGGYEPKKIGEKVMYYPKEHPQTKYPKGVLVTVQDMWVEKNPNFRRYIVIPIDDSYYKNKIKIEVNKLRDKFPFEKYIEPEDEEVLRAEPVYCNGERIVKLVNMALPLFEFEYTSSLYSEIDICINKLKKLKKYFEQ